ncbi:ArnT family glycosyltransferase [Hyphobacterium sp.]|uniref:ArnT family glycosyltransferase n=1 Tax=Hyphobacterium sp. TaxID=2004662 RepID=UPI003BAA683B
MSRRAGYLESLSPLTWGWTVILAITALRVIVLALTQLQLYPDESQYWIWSQTFDWGYFSKPPLIAWVIAASTGLLGDTDFAIRLPSILFHAMGAAFLMYTARDMRPGWAALWAPLVYLTLPGIGLSGLVISTDATLLPLLAGAFFLFWRLRSGAGWRTAVGLGIFLGLAFLAKYAAIYFLVGLGLAVLIDRPSRQALLTLKGLAAGLIVLALIAPNLAWNAANDFATVQHTAANANWQGRLFNFEELLEFLAGQFGVFGLLLFPALLAAAWTAWRHFDDAQWQTGRLLTLFSLPPLLVVAGQAFISRAHANWAASAYVAGTLLVVCLLLRGAAWRRGLLAVSVAIGLVFSAGISAVAIQPAIAGSHDLTRGIRHLRAWPETAEAIAAAAQRDAYTAIVFDNRNVFHQMQRYGGDWDTPLRMWQRYAAPHNHAEAVWALDPQAEGPFLIVSERAFDRARLAADFANTAEIGEIAISTGGHADRRFVLYAATGYQRMPRTAAYEDAQAAADAARRGGD